MAVPDESKPIHTAIIGGGIVGVILGVALSKYPHITFTIYESRGTFGEIGTGIAFAKNSHLAMKLISLALFESYRSRASFNGATAWPEKHDTWFDFTVGESGPNEGKKIIDVKMTDKWSQSTVHRGHFLDALVLVLPEGCAEFNKKLVDVDQSGEKVVCKFIDGTTAEADAVVGCDGIKSACRQLVFNKGLATPTFTQKVAYRGLIPMKVAEEAIGAEKANNRQMYLGHDGHMLTFPVSNGALMNVVAFHSRESWHDEEWIQQKQKDRVQSDFRGWGETVTKIIEVCHPLWFILQQLTFSAVGCT